MLEEDYITVFEDIYKNDPIGTVHDTICDDKVIKKNDEEKCYCFWCKKKTRWYSILLNIYVCSEECLREEWLRCWPE